MRTLLVLSVLLVLMFSQAHAAGPTTSCGKEPKVIPESKLSAPEFKELLVWLKADGLQSKNFLLKEFSEQALKYPNETLAYKVDVANDGHPKFVIGSVEGSGAYLYLRVFDQTGKTFHAIDIPVPKEFAGQDGGWYEHAYYNLSAKRSELFVDVCGVIHINFSGPETGSSETYVWKGKETKRACNDDWAIAQSSQFKQIYDRKQYDEAANNLQVFDDACKSSLSAETRLRLLSDLSVTYAHLNDNDMCASAIAEAKQLPGFSKSPTQAAILHNETMCADSLPQLNFKTADDLKTDQVYDSVLSATVPNMEFATNSYDTRAQKWADAGAIGKDTKMDSHRRFNLRDEVRKNLWGPGLGTQVIDPQTAVISGCRAHSCPDVALMWVDVKNKASVFVINSFPFEEKDAKCMTFGSRTLDGKNLPSSFWSSYKKWAKTVPTTACAYFVDGTKKQPEIRKIEIR